MTKTRAVPTNRSKAPFSSMTSPGSSPRKLPLQSLKISDLNVPRARFSSTARCDYVAPLKVFENRGGSGGQGVLLKMSFADETGLTFDDIILRLL